MCSCVFFFFFTATPTTEIYTLSLHDALPICDGGAVLRTVAPAWHFFEAAHRDPRSHYIAVSAPSRRHFGTSFRRSEEHTSELQSLTNLVCRLLLEKKKKKKLQNDIDSNRNTL